MAKQKTTAVKATKIELFRFCASAQDAIDTDRRSAWKELAVCIQRANNRMWQLWLIHHTQNDSANTLRRHLDRYARWKTSKSKTPAPKWPVQAVDSKLMKAMWAMLSNEFPHCNSRTLVLAMNKWRETVCKRKAASGSLPGWVSILFGYESMPSFTRPLPIPFDTRNSTLFRDGKHVSLSLRIERLPHSDKLAKPSVLETVSLMLDRRKARSQRAIIERIIDGEYEFKGSSLVLDKRTGKWFASISYAMPRASSAEALNKDWTMTLWPGKRRPWCVLDQCGQHSGRFKIGGRGEHVVAFRQRIAKERIERQQHNRWAGANTKGHGRRRAEEIWTKLSSRWKNFVQRYNHEMTTRLVRLCVRKGIGRMRYAQPDDTLRERLFLTNAGTTSRTASSWEYSQVKTMLSYKCQEAGIEFEAIDRGMPNLSKDDGEKPKKRRKR